MKNILSIADVYYYISLFEDKKLKVILKKEFFFQKKNKNNLKEKKIKLDNFLNFEKIDIPLSLRKKGIKTEQFLTSLIISFIETLLWQDNIFFLHGCSFYWDKKAYIFVGPSGIGKTTLIKKVPLEKRLSNDTAVIKKIKNSFFVYFSPFDKDFIEFKEECFLLSKIFILSKSKNGITKIKKIKKEDAFFYLIKNNFALINRKYFSKVKKTLFKLTLDLIRNVEIYKIELTLEESFENLLLKIK